MSANGQRVSSNNYQLDGVSVNSLNWGGAAVVTPNQESVKEMRVTANAYSAEYGRNSGAQIEIISRNGTNEFHGSALLKLNEPGLNAYNRYGGVEAPPVRVNNHFRQFAGSVGGPIIREKLFFFASYEGLRNQSTSFDTNFVETDQFRQSVIAARPGQHRCGGSQRIGYPTPDRCRSYDSVSVGFCVRIVSAGSRRSRHRISVRDGPADIREFPVVVWTAYRTFSLSNLPCRIACAGISTMSVEI